MKKIINCFNWAVFMALIISLCSLDSASWLPTITAVISGGYLALLGEAKGFFTAGVQNVHKR